MDPLRPFAGLIRTLWKSHGGTLPRTDSLPAKTELPADPPPVGNSGVALAGAEATLADLVRGRLAGVGTSDPRRAREAFIETVLVAELGEGLWRDPAFGGVVARVSEQLGADPALAAQLHVLLERLVAAR